MSKEEKDLQCCLRECKNMLDQAYWNTRWQNNETGWDMRQASPAIMEYYETIPR
jgi:hypothetical protein